MTVLFYYLLRAKIAKNAFFSKFFIRFMQILIQKMQQMLKSPYFERKMLFCFTRFHYLCSS